MGVHISLWPHWADWRISRQLLRLTERRGRAVFDYDGMALVRSCSRCYRRDACVPGNPDWKRWRRIRPA